MSSGDFAPLDQPPFMMDVLKKYIANQRLKKQEEAEQTAALHEERKARQEKKERDSITLEKTKQQLTGMKKRLTDLQQEKHDLFNQLKKVFSQEEEQKRRKEMFQAQREKEVKEILSKVGPAPSLDLSAIISGAQPQQNVHNFNTNIPTQVPPMKRWRPSSPPRAMPIPTFPPYNSPKQITSPSLYKHPYKPHLAGFAPPPNTKLLSPAAYASPPPSSLPPPPPPPRALPPRPLSMAGVPIIQHNRPIGGLTTGYPIQKSLTSSPSIANRAPFRF